MSFRAYFLSNRNKRSVEKLSRDFHEGPSLFRRRPSRLTHGSLSGPGPPSGPFLLVQISWLESEAAFSKEEGGL